MQILVFLVAQLSNDPMVRAPVSDPFHEDKTLLRAPPSSWPASLPGTWTDNNVRDPQTSQEEAWEGHTDADGHHHGKRAHHHGRERMHDSGWSMSVQGGAFARARRDYDKVGNVLGPAQGPAAMGGMFALQLNADIKHHLRLGGDFTYTGTRAFGVGPDLGGVEIRQSVSYQTFTGGLLVEGVIPVRKILEFSLGTSIGGGMLQVNANSSRVDSFYDLGADLRAAPKVQSLSLSAPVLHVKPAFGVRVRFSNHSISAFDVRVGANILWVPRGLMRINDDLIAYNSPNIAEIQPFIMAGVAFGDFASRAQK